jgi:hypothetical protein
MFTPLLCRGMEADPAAFGTDSQRRPTDVHLLNTTYSKS